MAIAVTHTFSSAIADDAASQAAGEVLPSHWNATHTLAGFGTGVEAALAVNVGTAGSPVINGGALGTPSSGTATNLTGTAAGLTAGTASAVAVGGITGLGSNVGTFLATPSSANLASALTDETGSGAAVFGTSPTIATPLLTTAVGSLSPGEIVGFVPKWTSGTVLGVSSGSAYIESLGYSIYAAPSDITPSSPSNSTWYHVYLKTDGTIEASTTAPVAFSTPRGNARSKSGDTSQRYLYSVRTSAAGAFYQFRYVEGSSLFLWVGPQLNATPFRTLSAGTASSSTAIDCSAVVPVTASVIFAEFLNTGTNAVYWVNGDLTVATTLNEVSVPVVATGASIEKLQTFCSCSASQAINYFVAVAGGVAYTDVHGFILNR